MKKKLLAMLLAICMVVSLLPTVALAADPAEDSGFVTATGSDGITSIGFAWDAETATEKAVEARNEGNNDNVSFNCIDATMWVKFADNLEEGEVKLTITKDGENPPAYEATYKNSSNENAPADKAIAGKVDFFTFATKTQSNSAYHRDPSEWLYPAGTYTALLTKDGEGGAIEELGRATITVGANPIKFENVEYSILDKTLSFELSKELLGVYVVALIDEENGNTWLASTDVDETSGNSGEYELNWTSASDDGNGKITISSVPPLEPGKTYTIGLSFQTSDGSAESRGDTVIASTTFTVPNAIASAGFAWTAAEANDKAGVSEELIDATMWVKVDANTATSNWYLGVWNKSGALVYHEAGTGDIKGKTAVFSFVSRDTPFDNWEAPSGTYTVKLYNSDSTITTPSDSQLIGSTTVEIGPEPDRTLTVTTEKGASTADGKIIVTYPGLLLGDYVLKLTSGSDTKLYGLCVTDTGSGLKLDPEPEDTTSKTDLEIKTAANADATTFTISNLAGGSYQVELLYRKADGSNNAVEAPATGGDIVDGGSVFVETSGTTNLLTGFDFGWTAAQANALFNKTNSIDATMWVQYGTLAAQKTYKLEIKDVETGDVIFELSGLTSADNGKASPFTFANSDAENSAYKSGWKYPTGSYEAILTDTSDSSVVGVLKLTVTKEEKPTMSYVSKTEDSVTVSYAPLLGEYYIKVTYPDGTTTVTYDTGVSNAGTLLMPTDKMSVNGDNITLSGLDLSATGTYKVELFFFDNPNSDNNSYKYNSDSTKYPNGIRDLVASTTFAVSPPYVPPVVTTYPATVAAAENGTVTVSPQNASGGTMVTVTPTAAEGYAVDVVSVADAMGNAVPVTDNGDGTYSFRMPYSRATVTATFKLVVNPFTDVEEGVWYTDAVMWAVAKGVTTGATTTTFEPYELCTRAQIVTFLWRAAGCPEPTATTTPFTDVELDGYYGKAVLWAVENGITNGTTTTTFEPDAACTRAQSVTFLWRYAGCPEPTTTTTPFTDVELHGYYGKAVLWAAENGVTTGATTTTFEPDENCTRSQIVTFLWRFLVD